MISAPSSTADRLGQLIRMLSSPHDGEIANAARAIGRVLEAERLDWHDLARGICTVPKPQPEPHYSNWRSGAEWCVRAHGPWHDSEKPPLRKGNDRPQKLFGLAARKRDHGIAHDRNADFVRQAPFDLFAVNESHLVGFG